MSIIIISALLCLFLLGLIIPQKVLYRSKAQFDQWRATYPVISGVIERLQLNTIYVAPVTVFFLGLFFINLVVVMGHRVPIVLRRAYLINRDSAMAGIDKVKDDPQAMTIMIRDEVGSTLRRGDPTRADGEEMLAGKAASYFRKRFWSVISQEGALSFIAVRNRFSPLGFLLFHVSFLLCLVGGLLVMYTRFSGTLVLTEGQEFNADITQFRQIKNDPKIFRALPELGITLLKVLPSYEGSVSTDLNVLMKVKYFSETFDTVARVNQPVKRGAVSILPSKIGISPLFVIRKKGGEELGGAYYSLNVPMGEEDSFEFPDLPYKVYVRFFPDFFEQDNKPMTRSFELKNPVFRLRVEREGKTLYDDYRSPGQWAAFDGLELSCRELRQWVEFLIVREYGNIPLFAGFIAGAAGLIMRLVFFQKTVRVHIEKFEGIYTFFLAGRSEYFQHIFKEELEQLVAGLSRELNGPDNATGGRTI